MIRFSVIERTTSARYLRPVLATRTETKRLWLLSLPTPYDPSGSIVAHSFTSLLFRGLSFNSLQF